MMLFNPAKNYVEWIAADINNPPPYVHKRCDLTLFGVGRCSSAGGAVADSTGGLNSISMTLVSTSSHHSASADGGASIFAGERLDIADNTAETAYDLNGSGNVSSFTLHTFGGKVGDVKAATGDGGTVAIEAPSGGIVVGSAGGADANTNIIFTGITWFYGVIVASTRATSHGFKSFLLGDGNSALTVGHNGSGAWERIAMAFAAVKPRWAH